MNRYDDIKGIADGDGKASERYDALARCFFDFLDEACVGATVSLAGPFAKTDYLLTEAKADPQFAAAVNSARVRFRNRHELTEIQAAEAFGTDIRIVTSFIALVSGEPVPDGLKPWTARTPRGPRSLATDSGTVPYIRAVVSETGPGYATIKPESDSDVVLTLDLSTPGHAYLADIIRRGDSVNLVNPHIDGLTADAEYIIYDPDFLVNVTQIAACFDDFGINPVAAIVNRFASMENTQAINLGNFASQMLDEEINRRDGEEDDFRRSAMTFFRSNAVNLATCELDGLFREQALEQRRNIRHAIRDILPDSVSTFRADSVILEPAFFSEMLGLQGRMDLMQSDYRVLLEQKSGKGAFSPGSDSSVPRHVLKHYVQLLLYMAIMRYNYRARYEANDRRLSAFLMYSKYAEPLIGLGMAPDLLRQAFEVRNMIVYHLRRIASGDTLWLAELTPEALYPHASGPFWIRYIRPRLAGLLEPLHSRDDLALRYFLRMLSFTELEHRVAKTGNNAKRASGFASAWQFSLAEKLEGGNIYASMSLVEPAQDHEGHVGDVVLSFGEDKANDMANFRVGDAVILYPYKPGVEPDLRTSMAFRCAVMEIGANRIFLKLRFAQSSARPFRNHDADLWAIEHDFMDSSFSAYYKGLHDFLTSPLPRRDLLLLRRPPLKEASRRLVYDHGQFNDLALRVKQARDLFLIIGPPGTGKTSFGLTTTLREELAEPDSSVLLISYTNRAVDEICSKLTEENIDFIRIGSDLACEPQFRPFLIKEKVADCRAVAEVRAKIRDTRVFTGTVSSLNASINLLKLKRFDLVVIDEASQILEPHLLPLLCARTSSGKPAIGKIVMIGDHKQLPAVVQQSRMESEVTDAALRAIGLTDCRLSLFERFLRRYGDDPDVTYMLSRQGRMHADIADFPNKTFYKGRLDIAGLAHQTLPPEICEDDSVVEKAVVGHRIAFVDVCEPFRIGDSDKINYAEAELITRLVRRIVAREKEFEAMTLGIIVPYRNQIATVRRYLVDAGLPADLIAVDTVERFQGSQRKYIIYGFTVKRAMQLNFLTEHTFTDTDGELVDRKLNVALTRAREHMILVGNTGLLDCAPVFHRLIEYCRAKGALYR